MSTTASAPFSKGDSDVAVAYLSAFILVFFVTLFPLGGHRLIAKDYADGAVPVDAGDDDTPEPALTRMRRRWANMRTMVHTHRSTTGVDSEAWQGDQVAQEKDLEIASPRPQPLTRHVSSSEPTACGGGQSTCPPTSTHASPAPTVVNSITTTLSQARGLSMHKEASSPSSKAESQSQPKPGRLKRALLSIWAFLISLAFPPTITMVVAFVIALVPTLKALFITPAAGSSVHIAPAPDGLPPLNFIIDTATFIGGGSVPLGLVCLGNALARLQVPKPFSRAPLSAIVALSILKASTRPVATESTV
ncbi:Protein M3 [Ceratobasidium sp. 414]|nr:Protein M3 [Ceratobasidium sp. 414]